MAATGTVMGLVLMIWTWARAASMSADGAHYMELAQRAWRLGPSAGMDWYAGPGYPVAAGCLYGLCGDLEFAGRLTSFLFGLGTLAGVGVLGLRLFGRTIAALAVAMLAVHTTFVRHTVMAETDAAYGCWLVWSLWLTWELKHARTAPRRAILSVLLGLALGIGYLTRPEAIPLAGLLGLWYLLPRKAGGRQGSGFRVQGSGVRSQKSAVVTRLAWLAVVGAIFLAVASPYLLHLRRELCRWSLSGKERSIVLKFVPDKRNYEDVLKLGVTGALLKQPSNVLHWLPYHLHWGLPQLVKALHPVVLALAGFGLWRARTRRSPRLTTHHSPLPTPALGAVGLLLWSSMPFIIFFFLTFPGRRYFMQAMPQWTILAAVGANELAGLVVRRRKRFGAALARAVPDTAKRFALVAATPMLLIAVSTWYRNLDPLEQSRRVERTIGERILQIAGPGRRVLSFTIPAFYARAERVPLWGPMQGIVRCHGYGKPLSYEEFVTYLRRHGVEYVVLDHDLRKDCPEFLDRVRSQEFELMIDDLQDTRGPCLVYRYRGLHDRTQIAN
jgi:4-amino-4-deoxy-L-arabinose transferase-like glycosyltransferase